MRHEDIPHARIGQVAGGNASPQRDYAAQFSIVNRKSRLEEVGTHGSLPLEALLQPANSRISGNLQQAQRGGVARGRMQMMPFRALSHGLGDGYSLVK